MSIGYSKGVTIGPTGPQGIQGATGPQGPIGTANTGTAILDFGSAPGTNSVSVDVTGQTGILNTSTIYCFVMTSDTTVSGSSGHNGLEHHLAPIKLAAGSIIPGSQFTIYAASKWRLTSTFKVRYFWF